MVPFSSPSNKIDPVEALEFLEAIHSTNAFAAATARPLGRLL